jgi:hypothetical protein
MTKLQSDTPAEGSYASLTERWLAAWRMLRYISSDTY